MIYAKPPTTIKGEKCTDMKLLNRMLRSPRLYISAILLLGTLFLGAKEIIEWYYQNWAYLHGNIPSDVNIEAVENIVNSMSGYNVFMNGIGMGGTGYYSLMAMLITGFLFTNEFVQGLNTGYAINEISRIGYKKYHLKTVILNFANSFLFYTCILLIFLIISVSIFSPTLPVEGRSPNMLSITTLFYRVPAIYCVIQILNQALFVSLFSTICMGIAVWSTNTFVTKITPLIFYLALTVITQLAYGITDIALFSLAFPDNIFMPFTMEGHTGLGFFLEKVVSYILFILLAILSQTMLYKRYSKSYLK